MKFEDILMQQNEKQRKRCNLEDEVIELQADLEKEHKVNRVLQCALHEPNNSRPRVSSWLPIQVQMLLAEVTIVEQEILCLERKFEELKICLYQEKKQTKEWQLFQQQQHQQKLQMHHICRSENRRKRRNRPSPLGQSFNSADFRSQRRSTERKTSLGSASDFTTISSHFNDVERTSNDQRRKQVTKSHRPSTEDPNRLSEDLINSLIGIFLKLNRPQAELNCEVSSTVPKLGLSCINSKGLVSKTSFNCKSSSNNYKTLFDPYGILPDIDGPVRDVGPYKNFMQFTRSSLDMNRLPECLPTIGKLRLTACGEPVATIRWQIYHRSQCKFAFRSVQVCNPTVATCSPYAVNRTVATLVKTVLLHKLSTIDFSYLTYKQKLAFWINIYNACIMHAYLQHGLPSTTDKQLTLMNKAALNVGGIILNALAIEHYILRHPYASNSSTQGEMDDKERLLWHAYGLGYPEPDVTFALCRGCRSSPALRVYTAKDVVNELGKAKVEFLEASVGVTNKKKILVPRLLHWHMQDFADNTKSLLEWIYSQLPQSGAVKRLIMECLNAETQTPVTKMVEIQSYESEFRYLFPQ